MKINTVHSDNLVQTGVLESEVAILERIRSTAPGHPGRCHVPLLLDSFQHEGIHGTHTCIIFPVRGPSVSAVLQELRFQRVSYGVAKRIIKRMLQALAFLHDECRLIHTG